MNVKTMITGLALSLLLSSGAANADWGDVYYCQMTNNYKITPEAEMEHYKLQKFQFKLDQTKNAMVFGSTGYFAELVIELTTGMNHPDLELWYAKSRSSIAFFERGKFFYSSVLPLGIKSLSAYCDKF